MRRSSCLLFASLVTLSLATEGGIRGSKSEQSETEKKFMDVEYINSVDLENLLVQVEADEKRLQSLEDVLLPGFQALPKSSERLTHHGVRYLLHRHFLESHGWLVKGLEPEGAYKVQSEIARRDWESWVPAYLEQHFDLVEKQRGANIKDLAKMVAVIEDLVRKESHGQMAQVYEALGFSQNEPLSREEADLAMDMYLIVVLTARNLTLAEPVKNRHRLEAFQKRYAHYPEMHSWLRELVTRFFDSGIAGDRVSFSSMRKVAEAFGNEFPQFNDQECQDLKKTLMSMEGGSRKPGRIPLNDFYNSSMYRHWRFTESPEYLRDLGALDESDVHRKYVILANYISSFNNCIRSDGLYAICCRSPCERLMHMLEEQVAAPAANAALLAGLVANLSTETVPVRGTLDAKLTDRLESIAQQAGGSVMLHSRLFAQWMHHAFPRECPYPHEAGTINPQTPDEWMRVKGRSTEVSAQQIEQIARDTCPTDKTEGLPIHCDMEDSDLPWNNHEDRDQLLSGSLHSHKTEKSGLDVGEVQVNSQDMAPSLIFLYFAILPVLMLFAYFVDRKLEPGKLRSPRCYPSLVPALAFIWGTVLCFILNIVDMKAAMGAGIVFVLWRLLMFHWIPVSISNTKTIDSAV